MSKALSDVDRRAAMFKALGNPNRLALFQRLSRCCVPGTACSTDDAIHRCVGELGQGLDIAPSTLSHHLKELNRAGLVEMERRGKEVHCWVEPKTLEELAAFFTHPLPSPDARPDGNHTRGAAS